MDGAPKLFTKYFLQYIKRYSRLIWAITLGLISFLIGRLSYFNEKPLFEFFFLGETVVLAVVFLVVYFYGKNIVEFVGQWFERLIYKTVSKILQDFWNAYSGRLVDAIVRRQSVRSIEEAEELKKYRNTVLLDTSTIIDGRILGVITTGFLDNKILVSQNVMGELQRMADKSDTLKRQKARRGLDVLNEIRSLVGKDKFKVIEIKEKGLDVDNSLVEFCKKSKAKIATVDYNLNKVAKVAGVEVLNINKLSNEIKTNLIPGEVLVVKIVQEGKEEGQGVGYLEDGTMIVVKEANIFINQETQVMVDKILQTSAGRMVFASIC